MTDKKLHDSFTEVMMSLKGAWKSFLAVLRSSKEKGRC